MVSETRYFRSDTWTVNGLLANKLQTARSGVAGEVLISIYDDNVNVPQYLGIRATVRHSDNSEDEITSGTAVAIASGDATALINATWTPPQTDLVATDAIIVSVYGNDATPPTIGLKTFITEQLGDTRLDASQWTVYYYLRRTYTSRPSPGLTRYFFDFDTVTYDSKITNFTHSTPAAGGVQLFTLINHEDY